MRLYVDNGALIVQSGFTHAPQKREEYRFFSGTWRLPSRIIVLDGKGGVTFPALQWLAERGLPLIHIDWRGNVVQVVGASGYAADRRLVAAQNAAVETGDSLKFGQQLITEKINNSIRTLRSSFPVSPAIERAAQLLENAADEMKNRPAKSIDRLLGIEGGAGHAYFNAWRAFPLRWNGISRKPIPDDWKRIGRRSSYVADPARPNKGATHPVNAILNYAYGVLESQVRGQVIASGLDPRIGLFHGKFRDKAALVYDLMEPLRPLVDQPVLEFVQQHCFAPADFTIASNGVCRLNPQLARNVVQLVDMSKQAEETVARVASQLRTRAS